MRNGKDGKIYQEYLKLFCNRGAIYHYRIQLTEIDHDKAGDGDYIIYFGDSKIEHAGKVYAGKIICRGKRESASSKKAS